MEQDRTILRQQIGIIATDEKKPGMMGRQTGTRARRGFWAVLNNPLYS